MQNCDDLKNQLLPSFDATVKTVHLCLAGLTEIDSAGLGVLVGLHMTTRKNKQLLQLLAPTEFQLRLFQVTRLNTVFTILGATEAGIVRERLEVDANSLPLPEVFEA
ncbi:MAG: STAS domain-containing protein [bacterium]|nr:STAS domain-containing protein [bacterium]